MQFVAASIVWQAELLASWRGRRRRCGGSRSGRRSSSRGRGLVLHANVKGTKALNVISDMPCAKVRLQVGLNSLPVNSLPVAAAYKPLTGQMGHIEPRKVPCLQRLQREGGAAKVETVNNSCTQDSNCTLPLASCLASCNPLTGAPFAYPLHSYPATSCHPCNQLQLNARVH